MKLVAISYSLFVTMFLLSSVSAQTPTDGENSFRLSAVNNRFLSEEDTISCSSGRGVFVAADPDLDGDGRAEVLVTQYGNGGRVFVFEVVGNDKLEFVWASPKMHPDVFQESPGQTPRSVSVGDFDNNGIMEIHFQIGDAQTDTLRGHYIYEFTGNDNDYGTEPVRVIKFEEIDPLFSNQVYGRLENPLTIADVDGDGKNEMLFTPRSFGNLDTGNLYILEIDTGTFENDDANIRVEYKYTAMARAREFGTDGYITIATDYGDIDNDGLNEIAVLGWTNFEAGGGIGFLEVSGVDTYTDGSVIGLSDSDFFRVKAGIKVVDVDGQTAVIFAGGEASIIGQILAIDNIVSEAFISSADVQVLVDDVNVTRWGVMGIGDQDHGSGSDGFDIFVTNVPEVYNIEYNGTGALSSPSSYTNHGRLGQFNLDEVYDVSDGLFVSIATYPGMDIDQDGNRDLVVAYKGGCSDDNPDQLEGVDIRKNNYGVFVFEWGDSTQSIPLTLATSVEDKRGFTIITPDDYHLEQNFPNPFNPETNIRFSLPVNKTVSLKIYNSLGQEVRTLIDNQAFSEGTYTVQWDARDDRGNPVASGVYLYKLVFGNFSKSKTMTLVR